METRRIRLREVREQDLPTLFKWRNTDEFRFLFHHNEDLLDYQGFYAEFNRDAGVRRFQYVIERASSRELMGLTFVHGFSEQAKHCKLNVFFNNVFERKGYGADVLALLFTFLFETVGVKRVYLEAFCYNTFSIASLRAAGLAEVERLEKEHFHAGEYHDVLRFVAEPAILPKAHSMLEKLCSNRAR